MENYADQGLKVFTNTFQYNSPYHVKVEFKNYFINSKRFSSSIIPYSSQARSRVPPRFHLCISSLKNKSLNCCRNQYQIILNLLCIQSDWKIFACFEDFYIKLKKTELVKIHVYLTCGLTDRMQRWIWNLYQRIQLSNNKFIDGTLGGNIWKT